MLPVVRWLPPVLLVLRVEDLIGPLSQVRQHIAVDQVFEDAEAVLQQLLIAGVVTWSHLIVPSSPGKGHMR